MERLSPRDASFLDIENAMFSDAGRPGFAVTADADTAPDSDVLSRAIEREMAELLAAS